MSNDNHNLLQQDYFFPHCGEVQTECEPLTNHKLFNGNIYSSVWCAVTLSRPPTWHRRTEPRQRCGQEQRTDGRWQLIDSCCCFALPGKCSKLLVDFSQPLLLSSVLLNQENISETSSSIYVSACRKLSASFVLWATTRTLLINWQPGGGD